MNICTQGIKYAGSKLKLLPVILDTIRDLKDVKTVLDGLQVLQGYLKH